LKVAVADKSDKAWHWRPYGKHLIVSKIITNKKYKTVPKVTGQFYMY